MPRLTASEKSFFHFSPRALRTSPAYGTGTFHTAVPLVGRLICETPSGELEIHLALLGAVVVQCGAQIRRVSCYALPFKTRDLFARNAELGAGIFRTCNLYCFLELA